MKIWHFSASGWFRGVATLGVLGALLVGAQSAQASLIGTQVDVFSQVSGFTGDDMNVTVVDDALNPELQSDDSSDHGMNFFLSGAGDFYDFQAEKIVIHFGPQSGGDGSITFSNLDWGSEQGTLTGVNVVVTDGELSTDVDIQNLTPTGFEATFSCSLDCAASGVTYELQLVVDHPPPGPPGPPGPNPPGVNIPEPSALLLFAFGLAGLGWMVRRRRLAA